MIEKLGERCPATATQGDLVTGEGHIVCGRCRNCLAGRRHLCANTLSVGVNRPGAFAEYLVLPSPTSGRPTRSIPLDVLALFDPLGNATHTALSFDLLGEDVLITGRRAHRLHGGGDRPPRRVLATWWSPMSTCTVSNWPGDGRLTRPRRPPESPHDAMKKLGMKEGFDVGLEMSGNPVAFRDMLENMSHGGQSRCLGFLARTERDRLGARHLQRPDHQGHLRPSRCTRPGTR